MIALLTDFGTDDIFVGVMKGVIESIAPRTAVVDLTHAIPAHNIGAGSFALLASYHYFPEQTIFVAIVDPGVGTDRRPVAISAGGRLFVGPDNGIFSGVIVEQKADQAKLLDNSAYHLPHATGATFQGRDIFAPVAAHLAAGAALDAVGSPLDQEQLIRLESSRPLVSGEVIMAHLQHVDRFGNLITDLREDTFRAWTPSRPPFLTIELDTMPARELPLCRTYGEVTIGEPCLLFNSLGLLEISINAGSASRFFGEPRSNAAVRIYRR